MQVEKLPQHCDKRPWVDIQRDDGYWRVFWDQRNTPEAWTIPIMAGATHDRAGN